MAFDYNPVQQKIINQTDGAVLVLAGAGSGKTRVLTGRIVKIIQDELAKPYQMLAITFTNKAAKEMRQRIVEQLGDAANDMWVLTFHAMCSRILRKHINELGENYTRSFSIYDDDDTLSIVKQALKELDIDASVLNPRTVKYHISEAKHNLKSPEEYLKYIGDDHRNKLICKAYSKYENMMKANNALDFNDLLVKTLELFVEKPEILKYYQNKFKYIHVDEYQDTNLTQYTLVRLFSIKHGNICVVGDDDQGIYSWRGADISNILNFEDDFASTHVFKLEQNYRSTKNILDCANCVIKNNTKRKEKELWTDKGTGDKIKLFSGETEKNEAFFIYNEITKLRGKYTYDDMAILYRTNSQSQVIESTLVNRGVPYKMYSGVKFYDRKEVKDVVAYLRAIVNPSDNVAIERIINVPKRAIGKTTVGRLMDYASDKGISLFDLMQNSDLVNSIVPRANAKINNFVTLLNDLKNKSTEMDSLVDYVTFVITESGLDKMYRELKTEDAEIRLQNIEEFVSAVQRYEQDAEEPTLTSFLENVSLTSETDNMDEDKQKVTMMTIHSSKGLEYPIVFLVGLEEGLFPHFRSLDDKNALEEERRLCYVGITRAKELLFVSKAKSRVTFGQKKYNSGSRFLNELPDELLNDITPKKTVSKSQPRVNSSLDFGIGTKSFEYSKPKKVKDKKPTVGLSFDKGDTVYHKKFGKGMILSTSGTSPNKKLEIAFENNGVKELIEKYAHLSADGEN